MQTILQSNPVDLPWIVQKYGGTSVGKFLNDIADTIVPLLRAAEEALIEGSNEHLNIVKEIRDDHINAARSFVKNPEILKELEDRLEKECLRLKSFLEAAEVNK
ncbi:hypothetical protein G6F56_012703 [Rhizopus delemar]|nr:hypothetical protein G6F56_012703 [Rhizopus delemar]